MVIGSFVTKVVQVHTHSLKFHANTVLYSGITQEHYRVQISTVIYSVTT